MRSRVIAHGRLTNLGVHDGIDLVPDFEGAPPYAVFVGACPELVEGWGFLYGLHNNLMCSNGLNRVITSRHIGDDSVVIIGVQPSPIPPLPARLGIERRVIENDLARFTRLQFLRALP